MLFIYLNVDKSVEFFGLLDLVFRRWGYCKMDMEITTKTFDERDEFQRKSIAEKAIKLLKSDIDISPMVIDGSWGTGKTEFCHKLINLMKEDETHSIIYIDAFKADHINEPLMTVLAEIIKTLPEDSRRESFIKKILPAVRFGIKALAKASVSHLLRQDFADVAEDFTDEIEEATDKAIDATAELILKEHVEAEKNLKTLQAALTEIASNSPIVIFIDELDRCRPSFAIDMLEIIKHTFDVDGVSFVLITNTQQLKASINHCYGQAVDAQRYIDKFVKFRFELSPRSNRNFLSPVLAASDYFFTLSIERGILTDSNVMGSNFEEAVNHLIRSNNLSLREIETLARHMQVAQSLSNSQMFNTDQRLGIVLLNTIIVMMICFQPELLVQIKNNVLDANALGVFLGIARLSILEDGYIEHQNPSSPGHSVRIRPNAVEVMMVILTEECNYNAEKYTPSKWQKIEWDDYIKEFMDGIPNEGEVRARLMKVESLMSLD